MTTITFRQFLEDIEVDRHLYTRDDADETVASLQQTINGSYNPFAHTRLNTWKKLPVKFPYDGFEVIYRKGERSDFDILLIDTRELPTLPLYTADKKSAKRVAISIGTEAHTVNLFADGGKIRKLKGLKTDVLSSSENYRGFGLAPMLYQTLVENGQVLFSSASQTPGGQSTWRRLINTLQGAADIAVVVDADDDAERILNKYARPGSALLDALTAVYGKTHYGRKRLKDGSKPFMAELLGAHDGQLLIVGDVAVLDKIAYQYDDTFWVVAPKGTLAPYVQNAVKAE